MTWASDETAEHCPPLHSSAASAIIIVEAVEGQDSHERVVEVCDEMYINQQFVTLLYVRAVLLRPS